MPFISRHRKETTVGLDNAQLRMLEDLYLPYKQKRRTKAQIALEAGLEGARHILMKRFAEDAGLLQPATDMQCLPRHLPGRDRALLVPEAVRFPLRKCDFSVYASISCIETRQLPG